MFYDLNVPIGDAEGGDEAGSAVGQKKKGLAPPSQQGPLTLGHLVPHLRTLQRLGYGAVALNKVVHGRLPRTPCAFGRVPYKMDDGSEGTLRQYTRLTVVLEDPQQNYGINSSNEIVRSYDIIAVQPENEKMFAIACTSLDVDIISLDLSVRIPFPIKAGYMRQAIERGLSFEFAYGPLVGDGTFRRNAIGNARMLLRLGLGKPRRRGGALSGGLFITGGASAPWQLRAPADVVNLAALLGVPPNIGRACIEGGAKHVFMRAATRKHTFRSAVMIVADCAARDRGQRDGGAEEGGAAPSAKRLRSGDSPGQQAGQSIIQPPSAPAKGTVPPTDMLDDFIQFK